MKKRLLSVLLVLTMATSMLAGCGGKKGTCDICGEETYVTSQKVFGETIYLCKDCKKGLKELGNLFK